MNILLIDNYDSFTHNLKASLVKVGAEVNVLRNDKIKPIDAQKYDGLVLSPGPSLPKDAGRLLDIVRENDSLPMLGICLGMQAIAQVNGLELVQPKEALHGVQTEIEHDGSFLFEDVSKTFQGARYHSWEVKNEQASNAAFTAFSDDHVMALAIHGKPHYGFQFHPESILTPEGETMIKNFLTHVNQRKNERVTSKIA